MTVSDIQSSQQSLSKPRTCAVITSFSDGTDLTTPAVKLVALTAGTIRFNDIDGTTVNLLAADLTAMGNVIDCPVRRIHATGTTGTRFLAYY